MPFVSSQDLAQNGNNTQQATPYGLTTWFTYNAREELVATVSNTVYAFDADVGGNPLWRRADLNGAGRAGRFAMRHRRRVSAGRADGGHAGHLSAAPPAVSRTGDGADGIASESQR